MRLACRNEQIVSALKKNLLVADLQFSLTLQQKHPFILLLEVQFPGRDVELTMRSM